MSLTNDIPPESSGETPVGFEHWLASEKHRIRSITAQYRNLPEEPGSSLVEFSITTDEGASTMHRVPLGEGKVEETARVWIRELETLSGLSIPLAVTNAP